MSTRIHIQANSSPEGGVAVFLYDQEAKGANLRIAKPITFFKEEHEPGVVIDKAAHISNDDAQVLFEELWNAGFRPKNVHVEMTTAVERAKNDHISDLRELLHKCLPTRLSN